MFSNNWRVKQDPAQSPEGNDRVSGWGQRSQRNGQDKGDRSTQGRFSRNEAHDTSRRSLNGAEADKAIEEGRRIYVGNLGYDTTPEDIETLFQDVPKESRTVNMSIDPMTKRNPGYCFVTFTSKQMADQALEVYDGKDFRSRTLRVKPGVRSDRSSRTQGSEPATRTSTNESTPYAYDRWKGSSDSDRQVNNNTSQEGRRLYVGGLPRLEDQPTVNLKVREIFEGFDVEVVSKLISPHPSKMEDGGNHYYCFVDLANSSQVDAAIKMFDGNEWGLRVSRASGVSGKSLERQRIYVGGLPDFGDESTTESEIRSLFNEYNVKWISKLCSPREPREGNGHFCFVELADGQEADAAIVNLDWTEKYGGKIRVKHSLGTSSSKPGEIGSGGWRGKRQSEA